MKLKTYMTHQSPIAHAVNSKHFDADKKNYEHATNNASDKN